MGGNKRFSGDNGEKKAPRKLDAFFAGMLANMTIEAAAAAAGIAASTAYRWLQRQDVIERLAEARRDAMKAAMSKLQQAASASVDCLSEIQSKGESESARVSAARTVLEQALKTMELQNLAERIEKLEAIAKTRSWKGTDEQSREAPGRGVNGHA